MRVSFESISLWRLRQLFSLRITRLGVALVIGGSCVASQAAVEGRLEPLPDTTRPHHYRIAVTPDTENSRFSAREQVDFEVLKVTQDIVVHSLGLTIEAVRVDGEQQAQVSFDDARERVIFRVVRPLQPGVHQLEVRYSGPIYGLDNQGLFKRSFTNGDGTGGEALFTMLCCINAGRRFAPLWDQTADKAVFELELTIAAGLDAVSNMPIVRREVIEGGKVRVSFEPSPKMSPYLLFFAVGEFEQLRGRVGATDVGIYVRRGMGHRARYSLDVSMKSLQYFNEYFAYPLPLPKLDGIAVSGASGFGGMENFGAIAYSEEHMLDGPDGSAPAALRDTHQLIAHEIAHQWFGDLVTAQTWDGLWLNEGFADWMEKKATEHFHPEWSIWMQDAAAARESAMGFDARAATFAIVPNHSFEDAITYSKSGQVIRMIEAYVGADAFREAMRAQMRRRALGNSVSSDIWEALEAASDLPVEQIGRDFTEQAGVPLIDVVSTRCAADAASTRVVLRQGRFGLDAASKASTSWHVPVTASVAGSTELARQVIHGAVPSAISVPGCGAVKINVGQVGYFRTRYDAASFAQLERNFEALAAADQLGLLNDTFALGEGGYVPLSHYLDLAARVPPSGDPMVWYQVALGAGKLDDYLAESPNRNAFRALMNSRLSTVLARIRWAASEGESLGTGVLRGRLIEALGQLGDAATRNEAVRRFRRADLDASELPPPIREVVLKVVGMGADLPVFLDLVKRAAAADTVEEKKRLLAFAAGAQDATIATRALNLVLSRSVPDEAIPPIVLAVSAVHPQLAFDFVTRNLKALQPRLTTNVREWLVVGVASSAADARMARKLESFAARNLSAEARQDVAAAKAMILFRDEVRRKRTASVDAWVRKAT